MMVTVTVYMMLRKKLGWNSKTIKVEGEKATLKEVLERIPELKQLIEDPLFIKEYIVLVNGVNITLLKGLNTEITGVTKIDIFPPGGGG